jgi:hypothetical protein
MKQLILKYKGFMMQILLIAVIFIAGLILNDDVALRIWSSLLIANWYFLLISVSGIFLMSLHYLTGAKWSEPLLPLLREFKKGILFLSFPFLVMLAGSGYLFRFDEQINYPIIGKAILTVIASVMLFFVYFFDDIFRNKKFTEKQRSIIELLVLIPALYILSKIWLRDLYPAYSNPVFIFYLISCSLLLGLSITALLFIRSYEDKLSANKNTLYNLGRYIIALVMIRGYLWFTHYLIIGYAGITNEITLLSKDVYLTGYQVIGILSSFLIPLIFLLFREVKENAKYMYRLAVLILIGQYIDLYYLVYRGSLVSNFRFSLIDIAVFYGFMLLFLLYLRNRKISI